MNALSMRWVITRGALAVIAIVGCSDHCTDVACAPAEPLLTVVVQDTVRVDTTLFIARTNPVRIDTVDTAIVLTRPITSATVTLLRVSGTDTTTADSLRLEGMSYYEQEIARLPQNAFIIRAARESRSVSLANVTLRHIGGCCPQDIVGYYTLTLPQK